MARFTLDMTIPPERRDLPPQVAGDWGAIVESITGLEPGDIVRQVAFTAKINRADLDNAATTIQRIVDATSTPTGQVAVDATNPLVYWAYIFIPPAEIDKLADSPHFYDLQVWVDRGGRTIFRTLIEGMVYARPGITGLATLLNAPVARVDLSPAGPLTPALGQTAVRLTATLYDAGNNIIPGSGAGARAIVWSIPVGDPQITLTPVAGRPDQMDVSFDAQGDFTVRATSEAAFDDVTGTVGPSAGVLFRYVPGDSLAAATFTRASAATFIDVNGVVQTAAAGVARDAHFIGGARHLLTEMQRTNWALFNTAPTTANGYSALATTIVSEGNAAPNGALEATRISMDPTGGQYQRPSETGSPTANRVFTGSLWARWVSGGQNVDLINTQSAVADTVSAPVTLPADGAWVRLSLTRVNAAGGTNGQAISIRAAGGNATAPVIEVWGYQMEEGYHASSTILTGAAAVTRAADVLTFPYAPVPQATSALVDVTSMGDTFAGSEAVYASIGSDFPGPYWWLARHSGTASLSAAYRVDGSTSSEPYVTVPAALAIGSRIRFRSRLVDGTGVDAGKLAQFISFLHNAEAEVAEVASGYITVPAAWGATTIRLGADAGQRPVIGAFRKVVILAGGARTITELEAA